MEEDSYNSRLVVQAQGVARDTVLSLRRQADFGPEHPGRTLVH